MHALAGGVTPEDELQACAWCDEGCEVEAPTVSEAIALLTCIKKKAAAGLHPDDGQTGTPTGGTIMNNVTSSVAEAIDIQTAPTLEAEDKARADGYATDTVTLHNWNLTQSIDKNPSGIWHVILREEPGHPIPARRAYLEACAKDHWYHLSDKDLAELTTRGYSWGHDVEALNPDEFRFTYVDRYELTDTLVGTRSGEWTGVFRRVTKAA